MNCPNCFVGDLQFLVEGILKFATDSLGRPCGTAEVMSTGNGCRVECDTCHAAYAVKEMGDGTAPVTLGELQLGDVEQRR